MRVADKRFNIVDGALLPIKDKRGSMCRVSLSNYFYFSTVHASLFIRERQKLIVRSGLYYLRLCSVSTDSGQFRISNEMTWPIEIIYWTENEFRVHRWTQPRMQRFFSLKRADATFSQPSEGAAGMCSGRNDQLQKLKSAKLLACAGIKTWAPAAISEQFCARLCKKRSFCCSSE